MPGKPYQSKLRPYEEELFSLLRSGKSYRQIAQTLNLKYGLQVTHNAIFSFARTRHAAHGGKPLFYEGLSVDISDQLIKQIAAIWTHDSTAIEGNTLTLGETVKVLELGLTINGKPLRDHQEVYGHARAIELIYRMIRQPEVTEEDLFALHRAVMDKSAVDVLHPVGAWKQDFNGTTGVVNGQSIYMEYASPSDVPLLMKRWLKEFNKAKDSVASPRKAVACYVWSHMSFVRIHPFFDGNGRVARLVANLPVLRGGYPPVVLSRQRRGDYIDMLWEYQNAVGKIQRDSPMMSRHPVIERFEMLLNTEWRHTVTLVETARNHEAKRAGSLRE
jgi:Fic family protein